MSTMPNEEAGPDWTMTRCVMEALQGNPQVDCDKDGIITLKDLVEYTADAIAGVKNDVLSVYMTGNVRPNRGTCGGGLRGYDISCFA